MNKLNRNQSPTTIPATAPPLTTGLQLGFSPDLSDLHFSGSHVASHCTEQVIFFFLEMMHMFAQESVRQFICPFFCRQRASEGSFTHFFVGSQEEQTVIDCFGTHFKVNGSFLIWAQSPLKQVGSEPSVVQISPAFFMQMGVSDRSRA
ncbi:Hypothetical_protein [Hexamita inflata]|uniref:Hypothetical_protein n=1 Tax=Hexamita inflata TaxID=28002 RepID=A0AA86NEJ5_9EUKA|nr:Hypothetical protein HINF_LOCUS5286 [Hexamita inflata]